MRRRHGKNQGFTLVELSIVLVIIGLIVGGVLLGQDLIKAAQTRAQITQIEKFNSAVNTFRVKYGYIPGDIPDPYASQFGFKARGGLPGEGDGNGTLQGAQTYGWSYPAGHVEATGETAVFWVDLSTAGLIDGAFSYASPSNWPGLDIMFTTSPSINGYFPQAKIGGGNYVYAYSSATCIANCSNYLSLGINYFGVSAVTQISAGSGSGKIVSNPVIPVAQAYAIDKKIDDGLPLAGAVRAMGLSNDICWSASNSWGGPNMWQNALGYGCGQGDAYDVLYITSISAYSIPASSTSCFDNGSNASNTVQYSMEVSNGSGPNCAISFQMQGAGR